MNSAFSRSITSSLPGWINIFLLCNSLNNNILSAASNSRTASVLGMNGVPQIQDEMAALAKLLNETMVRTQRTFYEGLISPYMIRRFYFSIDHHYDCIVGVAHIVIYGIYLSIN